MIVLIRLVELAGNALSKNAASISKAIVSHFSRNGTKYLISGGAAAGGGALFAAGKAVGHMQGKKEGSAEQAMRDKRKMDDLHKQHEEDREKWKRQKNEYEDMINDLID